jgi:SAM-dependent methyltransferase
MTQNIYDNDEFFAGYSRLGRSVAGLEGAAEWPSLRAMLPPLRGARVLDLGCGFGWFCRWAREEGAAQVRGIDVSEKMLARAEAETADAAVAYQRADLERLDLPEGTFDLVYSSLAFHYLENLDRLMAQIHRALTPGGRLVCSVEHPIYTASTKPGWIADPDGHKRWPIDSYQMEGPRTTDWLAPGVVKQHRTMTSYLNLLVQVGFFLRRIEEWGPTAEQVAAQPSLAEERERPMFLLLAADRP